MNPAESPHLVSCPECGRTVRAEAEPLMCADYWRHVPGEHRMKRAISVRHSGPKGEPGDNPEWTGALKADSHIPPDSNFSNAVARRYGFTDEV